MCCSLLQRLRRRRRRIIRGLRRCRSDEKLLITICRYTVTRSVVNGPRLYTSLFPTRILILPPSPAHGQPPVPPTLLRLTSHRVLRRQLRDRGCTFSNIQRTIQLGTLLASFSSFLTVLPTHIYFILSLFPSRVTLLFFSFLSSAITNSCNYHSSGYLELVTSLFLHNWPRSSFGTRELA
jgi:hypothetical protein